MDDSDKNYHEVYLGPDIAAALLGISQGIGELAEAVNSVSEELKKVAVELYMKDRDPGGGPG